MFYKYGIMLFIGQIPSKNEEFLSVLLPLPPLVEYENRLLRYEGRLRLKRHAAQIHSPRLSIPSTR